MSDLQIDTDVPADFDPFAGPAIVATAPSTEPQRELWTACQLGDEASLAFNESVSLWLRGRLDEGALRAALDDLASRHEALNIAFSADGTRFEVRAPSPVDLVRHDWSALDPADADGRLQALRDRVVAEPFDLTSGRLFRAELAVLSPSLSVLTLTAHHIVVDGWSIAVLVRDLAALYTGRTSGAVAALAPAERFSSYANEEAGKQRDGERAVHEAYWTQQFAGEVPVLELPSDRPRPPLKTYASAREDVTLDASLVVAIKKAGARQGASLFVTLLAAFEVLLHRTSSQDDVVVGIPAAGQSVGGRDSLVGHCVNMLPVRTQMHAGQKFTELLARLRGAVLDAYEHQEFTFGTLLRSLPITRDPSRLPLIQVTFNVDRGMSPETMPFHGLVAELRSNPRAYENFDLFLNAVEYEHGVVLECQYNTDLFDRRTIQRRLASLEQILRAVAVDPAQEIGALPIVSAEELEAIARWNETARQHPPGARVHDLIAAQVARTPDAVAVEVDGQELTYAELERRAWKVARRLRALGVKRGDYVGLCTERTFDMLVGLYGTLKSGAGYVPLDPGYPRERLEYMVSDARMSVVLTQARVQQELGLKAEHVVLLDADAGLAAESDQPLEPSPLDAQPEDPVYAIYTSGSTGRPKGVVLPHRALVNLLLSLKREPGMSASDVVLAVTTLSFDISKSEVILPLIAGARIVLASREVAADGVRLLALLRQCKATFIDATPVTYRLLMAAGWDRSDGLLAISAGEAMPTDLGHELLKRCREVWNAYGPTETCVWSTLWRVPTGFGRVLIGHPMDNTFCYILDARLQPVPIGVPGELFIGGDGVASGYHGRPDLTAERFVPDPARPGRRMYKTGDLARWLPTGELECLGRTDNQVKLRGFRIELGEIEDALNQHPNVKQAAVIKREDRPGDQRLVAYLTFHEQDPTPVSELRSHLKRTLPEYMIPQAFVPLEKMPLTPNGKIDRKSLPAPTGEDSRRRDDFVAPRTPAEARVAALWEQALGLPRVSVFDDFFALGGHSLLASQVLSRLRHDHGVELSFRTMFEAPTIAQFAALVDAAGGSAAAEQRRPRRRDGAGPIVPSLSQERMLLLEQMEPGRAIVHNLPAAWRLRGTLDVDALRRAIDAVVERHETLRTTFRLEGGRPVPSVAPFSPRALPVIDLSLRPEHERERAAVEFCDARALEPVDVAVGPLFRAWLLRLGSDDHVLSILPHNTVWDGWSFDLFLRELGRFYPALAAGGQPDRTPLPLDYADYAGWQRESLAGPAMARQIEYWRKQLAGPPPALELPLDRPRPEADEHRGADEVLQFSAEETEALAALGRAHGATLFMVLFAAYNAFLHRLTGLSDVTVGTPMRARSMPEFEDLIGPFVNAVVLRTRVEDSLTFEQLLQRVRDVTLDAVNHQEMPLEALGAKPPLVRNFFSLQDAKGRLRRLGDLDVSQIHVLPPASQSDTMIWFMEGKDGLLAVLNYNTALFDRDTAARWLRSLRTVLLEVARSPRTTLAELPAMAEADQRELAVLAVGEGSPRPDPSLDVILSRLDDDARQTSERLARALGEAGAGPGSRVGVYLDGGRDLLAGLAGSLAAGGVVAWLDPSASGDVLSEQLRAAELSAIVTRRAHLEALHGIAPRVLCLEDLPGGAPAPSAASRDAGLLLPVPAEDGTSWVPVPAPRLGRMLGCLIEAGVVTSADTVGVAAPAGHELVSFAMLQAWVVGATFGTAPDGADPLDPAYLGSLTVALAPTSCLESLAASGWNGNPSLKLIAIGPSPSPECRAALLARCAGLWHAWGHPSAGHVLTLRRVAADEQRRLLGRPIAGVRLDIVDAHGRLLPRGAAGRVRVGGELFESPRLVGVHARWTSDGQLESVAEDAGEAFVRGWRFAPAQIEAALGRHPAVARAAVEVRRDDGGGEELVAYVVRRGSEEFTTTELRRHLRKSFPRVLVPGAVVEVQSVPEVAPGVIDRSALCELDPERRTRFIAPSTPAEQLVAALWSDALRLARVSTTDKFFDLGGYSLLCFQMIDEIQRRTGTRLHPRSFVVDTLGQLAAQIVPR
jgi:amino acid adenylation domain-containing protein